MSSNPDIINFNAEMEHISSLGVSEKLKNLSIRELEKQIATLDKYKNICKMIIDWYEVESRKFFLVRGSRKRKIYLNIVNLNKGVLGNLENSLAELKLCMEMLTTNNKAHTELFGFLAASELTINLYKEYLSDERGLTTTIDGDLVSHTPPFGKLLINAGAINADNDK